MSASGIDCLNYGCLEGIPEARTLFAEYMGVTPQEIIVGGSASLTMMYDAADRAMHQGVLGGSQPWAAQGKIKFLCPVPGYDRHFTICQHLNMEMIPIPMTASGPDMDQIEREIQDPLVKGIWCVPKYSNPIGTTYSAETVQRFAALRPAAQDFRIFWDNAYSEHWLYRNTPIPNLLEACKKNGTADMVYMFGSTSKITFPGAGVCFFAASEENIAFTLKQLSAQAISWDKINMLRHVRFLKNIDGLRSHMEMHRTILRPKFDYVMQMLDEELIPYGAGSYTKPDGGYFIAYQAPAGCAKQIVALCKKAGVLLTPAGATHPHGEDPNDSWIRLAPSYPSIEEIKPAMEVFCLAVRLATVEQQIMRTNLFA